MSVPRAGAIATALALVLALAGCGSSSTLSVTSARPSTTQTAAAPPPAIDQLTAAEHPSTSQFPATSGRTLQQLGALVKSSVMLGPATGVFTPGTRRFAFGLNESSGAFVYAPTAIYISKTPQSPAFGPYLAPADPMSVAPQFRSQQNAGPGGIKAIYAAEVPLPHPGTFTVLALTKTPTGLVGAPGEIAVAASSQIPNVGQRAPDVATDTHGTLSLLTTRIPPESMHSVSLDQVLGKRPVALLFSTPQLCTSRVCGPVTDVAVELQHEFGNRVAFIHEEVFVGNDPHKGLRPQLHAFGLQTEPWLFVINRRGVIVARLEGAFGTTEVRQALAAALR